MSDQIVFLISGSLRAAGKRGVPEELLGPLMGRYCTESRAWASCGCRSGRSARLYRRDQRAAGSLNAWGCVIGVGQRVWPNRDPVEEEGGVNLYSFDLNSPTLYVDAYGLEGTRGGDDEFWKLPPEKRKPFLEEIGRAHV